MTETYFLLMSENKPKHVFQIRTNIIELPFLLPFWHDF